MASSPDICAERADAPQLREPSSEFEREPQTERPANSTADSFRRWVNRRWPSRTTRDTQAP